MSHTALHIDNLTLCYRQRPAVHHLSAEAACGSFVGIVGPNGAGKSTLLHGILGWIPPTSGHVTFAGEPVSRCLSRLSFLPQRRAIDPHFPVTVAGVVEQGRCQGRGFWHGFRHGFDAADQAAVEHAIDEMGLHDLRDRPLAQLSGGQQQRTFIARAMATGADVLLLDEPLTGLDDPTCRDLLQRLRRWADAGHLVVAVIHDLAAVRAACSHALLMNRELIACGPVAAVMTDANIARAYGGHP